MLFNLEGKKVLLTGASGGIGKAILTQLVEQGAEVCISGRRENILNEIKESSKGTVHVLPCDLSVESNAEEITQKAKDIMNGIDIVICNAGLTKDSLALRMKNEDFDEVVNFNLRSTFIINRNAIKLLLKNKGGRIINVSSVVGSSGNPGQANYAASKAGVVGLSKSLAQEVAKKNLTVNCIAPGFIATPMTDVLTTEQKDVITSRIPCGYIGDPNDIAYAVVYLASDEARYITGQTIHVNGGMLMV